MGIYCFGYFFNSNLCNVSKMKLPNAAAILWYLFGDNISSFYTCSILIVMEFSEPRTLWLCLLFQNIWRENGFTSCTRDLKKAMLHWLQFQLYQLLTAWNSVRWTKNVMGSRSQEPEVNDVSSWLISSHVKLATLW